MVVFIFCIHVKNSHIISRAASQALEQSYDCPNVSEVALKVMDTNDRYKYITTHKKSPPNPCVYVL